MKEGRGGGGGGKKRGAGKKEWTLAGLVHKVQKKRGERERGVGRRKGAQENKNKNNAR